MAEERISDSIKWYVAHTYSGYENKVKANIEKTVENRHLEDQILEVIVPVQEVLRVKTVKRGGKEVLEQKTVAEKTFPGYVIVHMVMNDETWYIVRNTRGVTGFVGPDSEPVPLSDEEVAKICRTEIAVEHEFLQGDTVVITNDLWKDQIGSVQAVDEEDRKVVVCINIFGQETPVELSFADVKKL